MPGRSVSRTLLFGDAWGDSEKALASRSPLLRHAEGTVATRWNLGGGWASVAAHDLEGPFSAKSDHLSSLSRSLSGTASITFARSRPPSIEFRRGMPI